MALSNWDTFAMNEKGESVCGTLVSPLGVKVSIYKNWILVSDKKAWQEGGKLINPHVMRIYNSYLFIHIDIKNIEKSTNNIFFYTCQPTSI